MDQILTQDQEKVKGIEILSFDEVELTRTEAATTSFVDVGTLTVFFFQEYNRFVLYLNGWGYALLKRLPVYASNKGDIKSRYYSFPVFNGFYNLKFNNSTPEALQNFETILSFNSKFIFKGEDKPALELDLSADDGIADNFEDIEQTMEVTPSGMGSIEDLEGGNPEKLAGTDKIMRGFAKFADKLSRTFTSQKTQNINMIEARDINSLRSFDTNSPFQYIWKHDVSSSFKLFLIFFIGWKNYSQR